jgi:hypothetical protein
MSLFIGAKNSSRDFFHSEFSRACLALSELIAIATTKIIAASGPTIQAVRLHPRFWFKNSQPVTKGQTVRAMIRHGSERSSLEHELRSGGVLLNQLHTVALQREHGPDGGADAGAAGPALFELLHQLSEGADECRLVEASGVAAGVTGIPAGGAGRAMAETSLCAVPMIRAHKVRACATTWSML